MTIWSTPTPTQFIQDERRSSIAKENHQAEGWVGTPTCQLRSRKGERIITKVKAVDFQ